MPTFKLPLSFDIQAVSPWTALWSPIGIRTGFANVTIGQSSEPAVEADVLSDVASYGKQLGRIGDALIVLLGHFHPMTPLTEEETAAIADLKNMLEQIAAVKDKHNRQAMRPRAPVPLPALLAPEPVVMSPRRCQPRPNRRPQPRRQLRHPLWHPLAARRARVSRLG